MGDTVGRMTCPLCGEEMQDLRASKSNKLYIYCDNGCRVWINSKNSRYIRAQLAQGKSVTMAKLGYIRPISKTQQTFSDDEEDDF